MEIIYYISLIVVIINGLRFMAGQFGKIVREAKWYWQIENAAETILYFYFIFYSLSK